MNAIGYVKGMALLAAASLLFGCATGDSSKKEKEDFATSGSAEADQRARGMVKEESDDAAQKARRSASKKGEGVQAEERELSLYERLGGEPGIKRIVDEFIARVIEDPRVNWSRKGIKSGGLLRRERSVEWNATPQNVALLKKHMVQFISLAAGGPTRYDGKNIKPGHANMQIAKGEFDATIGDLKASLDKLQIPNQEQKELLAIFEGTRPMIVPEK